MRLIVLTALAALTALPVVADEVTHTVLAFDRKAGLLVMKDKTIYTLSATDAEAPEGLKSGDRVKVTYEGLGEDGYAKIEMIEVIEMAN